MASPAVRSGRRDAGHPLVRRHDRLFPSYTIGNVASVQFFSAARRAHPDLLQRISRGEFAVLLGWLREHIHVHGRKFFSRELLGRATGSPLTPEPYLEYLRTKFGELYGIEPLSA